MTLKAADTLVANVAVFLMRVLQPEACETYLILLSQLICLVGFKLLRKLVKHIVSRFNIFFGQITWVNNSEIKHSESDEDQSNQSTSNPRINVRKVLTTQLFCNAHFSVISCSVEKDKIQRDNDDERE
jgi:hypothetical protein